MLWIPPHAWCHENVCLSDFPILHPDLPQNAFERPQMRHQRTPFISKWITVKPERKRVKLSPQMHSPSCKTRKQTFRESSALPLFVHNFGALHSRQIGTNRLKIHQSAVVWIFFRFRCAMHWHVYEEITKTRMRGTTMLSHRRVTDTSHESSV
jgi:hypothetical protein